MLALGGTALTAGFAVSLRDSLSAHKRRQLRDTLRLQARVSQLEDLRETASDEPVATEPATQPPETQRVGEVTHPEAQAPATTPVEPETTCLYRVAAYGSIIGVYDETGRLLRTVNVRLDTLPAVDREALAVGIVAQSWQELLALVEQYS